MIARQDAYVEKTDVWAKLSAPVPSGVISWRQDGKVTPRDGKYFARFVAYIEANTVRERLDSVVPGEWDLTLELLPPIPAEDGDGTQCSFKARLQILGVIREDVGTGRDYKQASTDAFKRAAVRFGIAHELYAYEQNWVEMDGEGKYAKPLEDPQVAYARRYGKARPATVASPTTDAAAAPPASLLTDMEVVSCPKCGGRMWDNRLTKRNPRAPDYKCQNRSCDGVIWPPKPAATAPAIEAKDEKPETRKSALVGAEEEELPF
ncbi:MAG TPA: Rad52/Rad22 family DNA repair protein [Gemmatimonadaceae bacterium]|nr:Rad52/Rad22 family DNA repair protein [Gemmatimonadaceae bacterium]